MRNLATLFPDADVIEGGIIGGGGHGGGADAHADPCFVHHLEHIFETVVRFPHQIAAAIIFVPDAELGNGTPPVAQLVEYA